MTAPSLNKLGRRPTLDGIRGVAIILVLLRHGAPSVFGGAGIVGVVAFFVLSGFLITSLLLEERDTTGTISLRKFYARRALRLLPALYLALAIFTVIAFDVYEGDVLRDALIYAGIAALYLTPFATFWDAYVPDQLGPVWTLGVEELFYLAWPVIFIALYLRLPHAALLRCMVLLIVATTALRLATWPLVGNSIYMWFTTWLSSLLIGCAMAIAWRRRNLAVPRMAVPVAAVIFTIAALWPDLRSSAWCYLVLITLIEVASAAVIVSAVQSPQRFEMKLLVNPILLWFGRRSYGLYLYNALFFVTDIPGVSGLAETAVKAVLTLGVAELSFRFVEMPALRLKRRYEHGGHSAGKEAATGLAS